MRLYFHDRVDNKHVDDVEELSIKLPGNDFEWVVISHESGSNEISIKRHRSDDENDELLINVPIQSLE